MKGTEIKHFFSSKELKHCIVVVKLFIRRTYIKWTRQMGGNGLGENEMAAEKLVSSIFYFPHKS